LTYGACFCILGTKSLHVWHKVLPQNMPKDSKAYRAWSASNSAAIARRTTKYKKVPVAVFQLITGGALQKIGEFDNADEASAAAGIRKDKKNRVVVTQLRNPTNKPSKPTAASSSGGSYYFIYTFQLEDAITDVDIKAKLALRGTAAARRESKQDRRRSKAGTRS
jgi:hypothetical protein